MQKNLVDLFNSVVRKVGRTNQVIKESDLNNNNLNRTQKQTLDAINDEIELTLSEHGWITTQSFDATLTTAGKPSLPTVSSISGGANSGKEERTLYVQITYDWPHDETQASDIAEVTVAKDEWLEVSGVSDPSTRANKWNLYVGETKENIVQQKSGISFGSTWHEETDGPLSFSGTNPPVKNVSNYALHGNENHPVDYKFIENLSLRSKNRDLKYKVDDEWTQFDLHDTKPSIPQYYRIRRLDSQARPIIQLHPTPKQKYTIHYSYNEQFQRLSEPDDRAPIEDQLVILGASMMLLDSDGQDYRLMTERYSQLLDRLKKRNKPTPDDIQYGSGSSRDHHLDRPKFPENINV